MPNIYLSYGYVLLDSQRTPALANFPLDKLLGGLEGFRVLESGLCFQPYQKLQGIVQEKGVLGKITISLEDFDQEKAAQKASLTEFVQKPYAKGIAVRLSFDGEGSVDTNPLSLLLEIKEKIDAVYWN